MMDLIYVFIVGDCDFEQNTCGWVDTSSGTQQWMQGSNGSTTANMGKGPAFDHTLGNGRGKFDRFVYLKYPNSFYDCTCTMMLYINLLSAVDPCDQCRPISACPSKAK
jgi:hypothetical protein